MRETGKPPITSHIKPSTTNPNTYLQKFTKIWEKYGIFQHFSEKIWEIYGRNLAESYKNVGHIKLEQKCSGITNHFLHPHPGEHPIIYTIIWREAKVKKS